MLTIAIIDKYPMIRKGLKYYFHDHFDEVNVLEADSVTSFRNLYPFQNPDLTKLKIIRIDAMFLVVPKAV